MIHERYAESEILIKNELLDNLVESRALFNKHLIQFLPVPPHLHHLPSVNTRQLT